MQSKMNLKIKFRESFRPFAPAVLRENVHDYFAMRYEEDSPYMLLVAPVLESRRKVHGESSAEGLATVNEVRSDIPAVTHVDYSARVQTVDRDRSPRFHDILRAFQAITGSAVLINTSFNVRGEPIVCTPDDAYRCFMATDIDVLVIEDFVLQKQEQPAPISEDERDRYLAEFELD
jgi:carbamoyltransferase